MIGSSAFAGVAEGLTTIPPKLLCDEMLKRLGRWLRAAGYDTVIADGGIADGDLLARARREGRLMITRDRKLAEHRDARGRLVVLRANDLQACVAELKERLGIDWLLKPFSRCVVCNSELAPIPPSLRSSIPHGLAPTRPDLHHCPMCWRIYWSGGHVDRMRKRLEDWREVPAHLVGQRPDTNDLPSELQARQEDGSASNHSGSPGQPRSGSCLLQALQLWRRRPLQCG